MVPVRISIVHAHRRSDELGLWVFPVLYSSCDGTSTRIFHATTRIPRRRHYAAEELDYKSSITSEIGDLTLYAILISLPICLF